MDELRQMIAQPAIVRAARICGLRRREEFGMWALIGFLAVVAVTVPIAVYLGRNAAISESEPPWNLVEISSRQVVILGGLAGFAVTGIVLLVTLARTSTEAERVSLNTVIIMFMTAYLFYVGAAVLFSFLPKEDPINGGPPRISFALAATLYYRTLFLAWFALHPLMKATALPVPAEALVWVLTASGTIGGFFTATNMNRVGVLQVREIFLLPLFALAGLAAYAAIIYGLGLEVRSPNAAMYLSLAFFGLNALTFIHFTLGLLAGSSARLCELLRKYQRRAYVADVQTTFTLLLFLWMALIGFI
jgi:hypothetical protein